MRSLNKAISVMLATAMTAVTLTACGGSTPTMTKSFVGTDSAFIDAVGWECSYVTTLKVNSDNTYELTYQNHMYGTTDPGVKGMRTVIYTGKYSQAPSSDGWDTHVDYTLQPADRIYFEQHEKGFGRSTIAGHCVIDTANWDDKMTSLVDPENNAMDAKAFLSEFGETMTVTVEDPALDAEDVNLGYRIITNPELKLVSYAG